MKNPPWPHRESNQRPSGLKRSDSTTCATACRTCVLYSFNSNTVSCTWLILATDNTVDYNTFLFISQIRIKRRKGRQTSVLFNHILICKDYITSVAGEWNMSVQNWCNDTDRGYRSRQRKPCSIAAELATNLIMSDLRSNPCVRDEGPAINCPSNGTID
jgi:hypothetical protein